MFNWTLGLIPPARHRGHFSDLRVDMRVSVSLLLIWPSITWSPLHFAPPLCESATVPHVNEWESPVKHTEWQMAPRTPLTAQLRAERGVICILIVCLYESKMDERANMDSITVSTFLLEGHRLTRSEWQKNLKEMAGWYKRFSAVEVGREGPQTKTVSASDWC